MRGLSLVVASGGHSSSRCAGLSLSRPVLLRSTGSRHAGSVIVAHGPSCSAARGIFPDQGLNPRVPCIGRQTLNHCATREAPPPRSILNTRIILLNYSDSKLSLFRSPLSFPVSLRIKARVLTVVCKAIHNLVP